MVKEISLSKAWYNLTPPSAVITQESEFDDLETKDNITIVCDLKQMDIDVSTENVEDWVTNDGPSHCFLTNDKIVADIIKGKMFFITMIREQLRWRRLLTPMIANFHQSLQLLRFLQFCPG